MTPEITIGDLIIETTRRCNMKCGHCLRGGAQKKDFDVSYLDKLLKKLFHVDCVILSGGEPSLVPNVIHNIINSFKKASPVGVSNFYIVTNGKSLSEDFLLAITRLYALCDENEVSEVKISRDVFHEYDDKIKRNIDKLRMFRFAYEEPVMEDPTNVVREGRAVDFGRHELNWYHGIEVESDDEIKIELLYINCFGDIFLNCDLSYRSQKKKDKAYLCHVDDFSADVLLKYILGSGIIFSPEKENCTTT